MSTQFDGQSYYEGATPIPKVGYDDAMSKNKGGAPSKFNEKRAEKLLQAVRGGNYLQTAASYAGISYQTLRRWLLKADEPGAPPEYVAFKESLEKARADAEVAALAKIQKAASEGAWQASAWYLERSWPERWGRRDTNRVELVGDGGGPVKVVSGIELDDASMNALAQRLASRAALEERQIEEAQIVEEYRGELEAGAPLAAPDDISELGNGNYGEAIPDNRSDEDDFWGDDEDRT